MQITLVSPYDPRPGTTAPEGAHVGGVERALLAMAQRLAARDHDVTILCSTNNAPGDGQEGALRFQRVRRSGTIFRAPIVDLASRLDAADLVHVPATYPGITPRVVKHCRRHGVPVVLDFHVEPHPEPLVTRAAASLYRRVATRAYRLADAVLVRSVAYAREAASLRTVPEHRWHVLPNGVDPARFHAAADDAEGDYLLFVGRLVPYKGLRVLLDAIDRHPPGLPLLIAGDGPLRDPLKAIATRRGLDVRFLGHVPEDALVPLYQGARVSVLPSVSGQEAFGICLLESMACGTPVVASALPGVADVARHGGLIAPPGDPDTLGMQIRRAITPGTLRRGVRLAARIHEHFSWDSITDRLESIYQEIHDEPYLPHARGGPHAHPFGEPLL